VKNKFLSILSLFAAMFLIQSCAVSKNTTATSSYNQEVFDEAVGKVKPALVRIQIVEPTYRQGRELKFVATGSGSIITDDGYVITNHHVAGKAIRIMCTMSNREEIPAILIGTDPATDVAVIKLTPETPRKFSIVKFGNSDAVQVGDPVLALGSPLGLSQSVTNGIIANTEMVIPDYAGGLELDGENVGNLVRWFGHDAQIFGGNSGGPLVNLQGEMIGVNEIGFGLSGAIPGNLAREVAFEIIEKGMVERAFIGMSAQPLLKAQENMQGVLLSSVYKNSPAEKAGLQSGDIITSVAGKPVSALFTEDLMAINQTFGSLSIDEPSELKLIRDGEKMMVEIVPTLRQSNLTKNEVYKGWGMTIRDLTQPILLSIAREKEQGVMVTSVSQGAPVSKSKPNIKYGDIITKINGETVADLKSFEEINSTLEPAEGDELVDTLVEFERDGEIFLTVVEVGIEELEDPGLEVRKAWLPMETQVLTKEIAEQMGMEDQKGVRVTRIYSIAGDDYPFQVGDILTKMDDEEIDASDEVDSEVFRTMVRNYRLSAIAEFEVIRDGEIVSFESGFLPSPRRSREMERYRDIEFEFILRDATFFDRQDERLKGLEFSVITDSVTEGGWASLAGLGVGDVLLEIEGNKIESLEDVEESMQKIRDEKPLYVTFKVRRGIQTKYLEIEPFWES